MTEDEKSFQNWWNGPSGFGNFTMGEFILETQNDPKDLKETLREAFTAGRQAGQATTGVNEAAQVMAELMEKRKWPAYPILMPYTKEGKGPATIGHDASGVCFEVWEADSFLSLSSHEFLPDAIAASLRSFANYSIG